MDNLNIFSHFLITLTLVDSETETNSGILWYNFIQLFQTTNLKFCSFMDIEWERFYIRVGLYTIINF